MDHLVFSREKSSSIVLGLKICIVGVTDDMLVFNSEIVLSFYSQYQFSFSPVIFGWSSTGSTVLMVFW